ncbi:prenyltransferase/squalene oxidase repeat-containing protein [soil metagenome]
MCAIRRVISWSVVVLSRTRPQRRVFVWPLARSESIGYSGSLRQLFAVLAFFGLLAGSGFAATISAFNTDDQVSTAAVWLINQQQDDGGFPGFTGESDASVTADALIALMAASSLGFDSELDSAVEFLAENALVMAQTGPGLAAKLSLALIAFDLNPRDFADVNPLSIVEMDARDGQIGFGPYDHALGLLALTAAGESAPSASVEYALNTQSEDGGWAFDGSTEAGTADTNTTSLMIRALKASAADEPEAFDRASMYLISAQTEGGGFPYQHDGPEDSNSTALAVQALIALDFDSTHDPLRRAVEALSVFQNANGSFSWMLDERDENMFSTVQALPALVDASAIAAMYDAGLPMAATPILSPVALVEAA